MYVGEEVIVDKYQINDICRAMNNTAMKASAAGKDPKTRERVLQAFDHVAKVIMNCFMDGGESGGEAFNLYKSHANPLTAKKIRIGLGECYDFLVFICCVFIVTSLRRPSCKISALKKKVEKWKWNTKKEKKIRKT